MRMLLDLMFHNTAGSVLPFGDLGVFMGTTEGIAAGAVPDPDTAGDNPGWLFRTRIVIPGTSIDAPETARVKEDIRAMRRFGAQDRDLALVFNAGSVSNIDMTGIVRLLIKLP